MAVINEAQIHPSNRAQLNAWDGDEGTWTISARRSPVRGRQQ